MRHFGFITAALVLMTSSATAQGLNKVVFGPLEGDDAGVLTVLNGQAIEIEEWVRTDPDNPAPIMGVVHSLMSADSIIASRDGATFDPDYGYPCWDTLVSPPLGPDDDPDIPEGHTIQFAGAIFSIFEPPCDFLDTNGDWDYYGSFLMTCNTDVPIDVTCYPFSEGWYPHSGQGTSWAFDVPPGGSIIPEQDFCGLYFAPECDYVLYDCNHNGVPWELSDAVTMIALYRGLVEPPYTCYCPPHGEDFPPDADPDGDCVPFEMTDVLIMLGGPPMWPHGCLDCPPPGWLDGGRAEKTGIVPTLKSKARIKKQIKSERAK